MPVRKDGSIIVCTLLYKFKKKVINEREPVIHYCSADVPIIKTIESLSAVFSVGSSIEWMLVLTQESVYLVRIGFMESQTCSCGRDDADLNHLIFLVVIMAYSYCRVNYCLFMYLFLLTILPSFMISIQTYIIRLLCM